MAQFNRIMSLAPNGTVLVLSIWTIPFLQGACNGYLARLGRRIRILLVGFCSTAHVSCDASVSLFEKIRLCPGCWFFVETRREMSQLFYFIYSTFGNGKRPNTVSGNGIPMFWCKGTGVVVEWIIRSMFHKSSESLKLLVPLRMTFFHQLTL